MKTLIRLLVILALLIPQVVTASGVSGGSSGQASDTALTTLSSKLFAASSLTGGAAGALDAIAVAGIADGDIALVGTTDGNFYSYTYESSSATAESSPSVIKPDDNSGNGRWILQYHAVSGVIQLGTVYLPSSNADPGTAAGNIRHDSTDTDASAGGIVEWYDGTNTRRVVDGAASAAANYTVIVKTEFIPVAWMTDGAAAPGALTTYETTKYRDFADDATKDLQFIWMTPLDLIGTTIKVRAIAMVTNATAPTNEQGVSWGISAAAVAGSASVDAARGTEVFSEDTDLDEDCNAQYDACYFPYVEVTPAVTVTAGTLMAFTINRDHDNDDDTYDQDIGLIGVEIKYKARINLVDTW